MELRQARYFVAVARELSFTRAAQMLNLSQPPLSLQIRKLEAEIGAPLFVRAGHSVYLTPAGAAFLPKAERVIREVESAIGTARDAAAGIIGTLHLGFVATASYSLVPSLARHFADTHPHARLLLSDLSNLEQSELLAARELDMGILRTPAETGAFETIRLTRERYLAMVSADHPLASKSRCTLAEIAGSGLIMAPRTVAPTMFDTIMRQFNEAGITPRITHELRGLKAILDIAAAGLGVAIQPESSRNLRTKGLASLEIADFQATSELSLVYSASSTNPLVHAVATHMRAMMTDQPAPVSAGSHVDAR